MIPMSKYALMVGTVAAAIGIGFFMQNSPTAQARYGNPVQVASLSPDLTGTTLTDIATDVSLVSDAIADRVEDSQNPGAARSVPGPRPDVEQMADPLPAAPDATQADPQHPPADAVDLAAAGPADTDLPSRAAADAALSDPAPRCEAQMTAVAQTAAMVALTLSSCQPHTTATIHHNGMMVQGVTDAKGTLQITLPALAETALFIAEFPNREGAVATTTVPALTDFDRVVLQWRGDAGFALNAFEFDADFGTDGHRFRDTPGSLQAAALGLAGAVTQHGDASLPDGLRAEAYTFARGTTDRVGTIAFTVEAAVTTGNCGQEIAAQTLQISAGAGLEVRELVLTMPDCNAVGDYIVLNNMAEDLNIAAN